MPENASSSTPATTSTSQDISIVCSDGFELGGTLFRPDKVKCAVMIGPATGIKRGVYHHFAAYLADNGIGVITFDNRGIGDSVKGSINKCGATLENWGRLDMAGALERLKTEFPAVTYHLIGNSAGGQLMGLMPNYKDLSSIFNVSCSSGSISNNTFLFSLQAHFFLSFYIPLNNLIFGNSNSHWVGMGEPLPKKIGADWGRYCRGRGYVEQDLGTRIKEHWYGEISVPSLWLWATDDKIANLANVKDMIRVMPKLDAKIEALDPKELGIKGGIGHMGFFRRKCQGLWVKAVEWLEGNMG